MKCLKSLFSILVICFILFGCTNEDTHETYINEGSNKNNPLSNPYPTRSATEIIIDYTSNGFKIRNTNNAANGNTYGYIYLAFAESPFKTSNAR